MSESPRVVGRYLLCDAFAAGGMATVHLARLLGPSGFSRAVAIKQLHPQFANNADFVSMLLEEAKLASRIRHSNVVSPLDVVVLDGEILVVMDYVHGESLARLLRQAEKPPTPAVVSAVMSQALLGLHAAHEAIGLNGEALEMVHRDVSPQNILVGEDGATRVVDFGIAKPRGWAHTTQSGVLKGKLGYMAPEQLRMEAVDRRTDIFTAGVVLWEMLTGKRLFSGDTLTRVAEQMANAERDIAADTRPEIPEGLRQIALRALASDAQSRYRTAWEMAGAIAAVVPPATSLEVRAWVTELAGPALRERAERLAALEALSAEELPKAGPVSPPLAGLDGTAPLFVGEVTPSALSVPPRRFTSSHGQAALLVAALALGAGGVFVAGKQLRSGPSAQAHSLASRAQVDTTLPAAKAGEPIMAAIHPSLPAEAPSSAATPAIARKAVPATAAKTTEIAPGSASANAANASTARRPRAVPALPSSCDVPFVIDASGVKRFKPECF